MSRLTPVSAPVSRVRISIVAARSSPAAEGSRTPRRHAADRARGLRRRARHLGCRPRTGTHVARGRRARGRRRRRRRRHRRLRQPGGGRDRAPARAARAGRQRRRGRARLGGDVPVDAEHRPPRRRPARDQRDRHRPLGPAREAARRPGLRAARRQGPPLAAGLRELALRDRGSRRARARGRLVGGAGLHGGEATASRTGRSTGREGIATERRARANGGRCGRARRRRDGRRIHELGRRLRDSLHPRDRGRGASACAGSRSPSFPTTSPASRASAPPSRRRSPRASTRRRGTASASSSPRAPSTCSSRT